MQSASSSAAEGRARGGGEGEHWPPRFAARIQRPWRSVRPPVGA